ISLPVRGLRPLRAARRVTTNVPKPEIVTRRPRRSDSTMPQTKAFMARSAEIFEPPAFFAMIATISALVIVKSVLACREGGVNDDVRPDAPRRETRGLRTSGVVQNAPEHATKGKDRPRSGTEGYDVT